MAGVGVADGEGVHEGRPGEAKLTPDWDLIPGARGCTPESCGFRDHAAELWDAGAGTLVRSLPGRGAVFAVASLSPEQRALSDAYFEGRYWLQTSSGHPGGADGRLRRGDVAGARHDHDGQAGQVPE